MIIHTCFQESDHTKVVGVNHLPKVKAESVTVPPTNILDNERYWPIHV